MYKIFLAFFHVAATSVCLILFFEAASEIMLPFLIVYVVDLRKFLQGSTPCTEGEGAMYN
jgi:hypothetical protein